ncbi:hypothetical protein Ae706Ps2_3164c [Pseudonocardia sp. Ae706_Ps2]|nr:hypothetical protein Ae706Ps2_3164c [Pseudonocardia sp. Ae706_Ps2]
MTGSGSAIGSCGGRRGVQSAGRAAAVAGPSAGSAVAPVVGAGGIPLVDGAGKASRARDGTGRGAGAGAGSSSQGSGPSSRRCSSREVRPNSRNGDIVVARVIDAGRAGAGWTCPSVPYAHPGRVCGGGR